MDEFDALLKQYETPAADGDKKEDKPDILVIDDDASMRSGIKSALTHKYAVTTADNGQEGIDLLNKAFHCVILDVKMQGMNGFETYPKLKEKCPAIPIVFFTAFQSEHDLQEIINQYKPEGYVEKGKDISFLEHLIENAIAKYHLILENEEYKKDLEKKVEVRTLELQRNLEKTKELQNQLIESEKRAAVYYLVAGVRHEMNTHIQTIQTNLQTMQYETLDYAKQMIEIAEKLFVSIQDEDFLKAQEIVTSDLDDLFEDISDLNDTLPNKIDSQLQNAIRAVKIMKEIINQLKEVSENEEYEMRIENIKAIIEETITYIDAKVKEKLPNYKWKIQSSRENLTLECNKFKLMQALTAQIMNSVDAMMLKGYDNDQRPEIIFGVSETGGNISIVTQDNGIGIKKEYLKDVFNPFFSRKGRGQSGTGLGLSQVSAIISRQSRLAST